MNTIGSTGHTTGPQSRFTRTKGATEYREPLAVGVGAENVAGAADSAGGLRASCADPDTYPWRIVGHGDGTWSVEGHNSTVHRGPDCDYAHATARAYKVLHPEGYVDQLNAAGEPINISGPNHTIPQRLAGLLFTLTNIETDATVKYVALPDQPDQRATQVFDLTRNARRSIPVTALANNPRLKVRLNIEQFLDIEHDVQFAASEATAELA